MLIPNSNRKNGGKLKPSNWTFGQDPPNTLSQNSQVFYAFGKDEVFGVRYIALIVSALLRRRAASWAAPELLVLLPWPWFCVRSAAKCCKQAKSSLWISGMLMSSSTTPGGCHNVTHLFITLIHWQFKKTSCMEVGSFSLMGFQRVSDIAHGCGKAQLCYTYCWYQVSNNHWAPKPYLQNKRA